MSFIILYLGTRYDVCGCNSLRDVTILFILFYFDLHIWPSAPVKATYLFFHLDVPCVVVYMHILVVSMKFVDFDKIWYMDNSFQKFWIRHNDVIPHSTFNKFIYKSYQSDIPNFILIGSVPAVPARKSLSRYYCSEQYRDSWHNLSVIRGKHTNWRICCMD